MGYKHFLKDGSAYTVQQHFSSSASVHRFVSERELTAGTAASTYHSTLNTLYQGSLATRLKEQRLEPNQSVQFTTQALLRR